MYNRFLILLLGIVTFSIITSCDVNNANDTPEAIEIPSQIAESVEAIDVLQTNEGIYIFGEARTANEGERNFYLAQIEPNGNIVWENMYGITSDKRAAEIISTSDSYLLMVGATAQERPSGSNLYVVKVDFSGNVDWEKTYNFEPDELGSGVYSGRAVIEVNDGYIIGGIGVISTPVGGAESFNAPVITKLDFDGTRIFAEPVVRDNGIILELANDADSPNQFVAAGDINGSDLTRLDSNGNILKSNDFIESGYQISGLEEFDDSFIAIDGGGTQLITYNISKNGSQIDDMVYQSFENQSANNLDLLLGSESSITTGYVSNGTNNQDVYAVKNNDDLTTEWEFTFDFATREEAVGAFVTPNGGSGIIFNAFGSETAQSRVYYIRLDENGTLQ